MDPNMTQLKLPLMQVHIADIHFGVIDPKVTYEILYEQFLKPISRIDFKLLSIDGDLFDRKFFANHPAVQYAMKFVSDCCMLCKARNAVMIILEGTQSHDNFQIELFRDVLDPAVDVRIVTTARFEEVYGYKILCLPEEYGKPETYYQNVLKEAYDMCILHGTVVGSVYGAKQENLNSTKYPVFSIDSFDGCRGPIVAGHVHKSICLNKYIYYVSNPIRDKFGEEEPKGFAVVWISPWGHCFRFVPIESFNYITIPFMDIVSMDVDKMVQFLDAKLADGVTHIRIDMMGISAEQEHLVEIIRKYYMLNPNVVFKRAEIYTGGVNGGDDTPEVKDLHDGQFAFVLDNTVDPMRKFIQYVNANEGEGFITIESLQALLKGAN